MQSVARASATVRQACAIETSINPQPEVEIASFEYRTGATAMKPLAVAITAE
jgi:hypothetical protein